MRWCAMLLLALLAAPVAAAERPVTYEEALAAALRSNPQLAGAVLAEDAARASVVAAGGIFDPLLAVDGTWRRSDTEGFFQGFPFEAESRTWDARSSVGGSLQTGTGYNLSAGLDRNFTRSVTQFGPGAEQERLQDTYTARFDASITQQLLRGHRLAYNVQNVTRARRALDVAGLTLEQQRQQVLADTAEAYWGWVYAERLAEIARDAVEVAEEALRVVSLRVEAGDLAPVERTRVEASLVQAQAEAIDARNGAFQAADALLLRMGQAPGQAVVPATPPDRLPELRIEPGAAVEVALAQNLDLALSRARLETARLELAAARHGTLPALSATGAVGRGSQQESPGEAITGLTGPQAFPYVQVSGAFSVPIGNRAARGERDRVQAELHQRTLEVEDLERVVRSQVEHQVRRLQAAAQRVELAEANARLAEQTLQAEEALAEVGRAIQRDVLQARNAARRAQEEAARARVDHHLARVELLRLQGQLEATRP